MESPQEVAKRWAQRMAAEVGKWEKGVQGVTEPPTHKAAAAVADYVAGVQRAANSGKFEASLRAVSGEEWKRRTVAKRDRVASGAAEAQPRMAQYLTEALPVIENIRQQVRAMPGNTRDARMARMLEFSRKMAEFGDNRRGR